MPYLSSHGTMKPPLGAQIDPAHPFARGRMFTLLCNERRPLAAGATLRAPTGLVTVGSALSLQATVTGSPVWVSNRDGAALQFGTASALTFFPDTGDQVWLPTTAVTVAFIRRRTSASLGSFVVTQTRGGKLDIYAPFSDGTVYWDFGGQSSPNRLSVSGLSFTNALITPERWIFSAGPQGSAIWRDGVKLASQATAITRASDSAETLILNSTDYNEFNFVQMHTVQWSDDLCRWWSAEPYAHLYPRPMTYIGSSHGKGKLPAGIIGATAPSAGASGTGPLCTTLGVG